MKTINAMYAIICRDRLNAPPEETSVLYADESQWLLVHELAYMLSILNPKQIVVIMSYAYFEEGHIDTVYYAGEQYESDSGTIYRYDSEDEDANIIVLKDTENGIVQCYHWSETADSAMPLS